MITITIECQKCETHEAVEADGVIAIYLDSRTIKLISHELTDAEMVGLLVVAQANMLRRMMGEGKGEEI